MPAVIILSLKMQMALRSAANKYYLRVRFVFLFLVHQLRPAFVQHSFFLIR